MGAAPMTGLDPAPQSDLGRREQLKSAAISGMRWIVLTRVVTEIAIVAASVVLARLIPPAEFGRAAVVRIIPMLTVILMFEALGALLVQRAQAGEQHMSTATALALVSGLVLSVLTFLLAPLIADPVFGARTADLVEIVAPTFLLASIGVVPRAILQRRLEFRCLTLISGLALILGAIFSVILAAAGLDAEAIVLGALATLALESAMLIAIAPPPRPRMRRREAAELVRFGLPASLSGVTYVARRNVDYVILGALLPASAVGYYFRAFQVGAEYQSRITDAMHLILFPVFSRADDVATVRALRVKVMRINALIASPLLSLLVITAPLVIPLVYGEEWTPAVVPAQILAVAGLSLALLTGTEAMTLAAGKPRLLLRFNLAFLAAVALAAAIGSSSGLTAVCVAISLVHVGALVAGQHFLVRRTLGTESLQLWAALSPAVAPTVALLAAAGACRVAAQAAELADAIVLGLILVTGVLAYTVALRALHPSTWAEMRGLAVRLAGRSRSASGAA